MKLISALLPLLLAMPLMAQDAVVADTTTVVKDTSAVSTATTYDSKLKEVWNTLSSKENFHLLDNATPSSYYDFNKKEWLAGATSTLYKVQHVSFDVGIAKSIEQGQQAFPTTAIKFHGGEILSANSRVQDLMATFGLNQGLLQYATGGGWAARDFNIGDYRYGAFLGAELKF